MSEGFEPAVAPLRPPRFRAGTSCACGFCMPAVTVDDQRFPVLCGPRTDRAGQVSGGVEPVVRYRWPRARGGLEPGPILFQRPRP
jgi:hypothetical protein